MSMADGSSMRLHAGPLRSLAHRRAAHRRRAHGALQLAARPRRNGGDAACCASRTPTASARRPRTSSRSSTRCAGWSSTGTRGRSSRSQRADRHREALEQLLDRGHAYRSNATADDVKAYKERARRTTAASAASPRSEGAVRLRVPDEGADRRPRRHPRRDRPSQHEHLDDPVIARADGIRALQLRRRGRRPRRRHHPRRARRGPPLQHAQAAARARGARRAAARSTRTCRCCTAPTARSSPSATARPRCRSCATPATCPRRCATTSRCSAGATRTTRRCSPPRSWCGASASSDVSRNPARFDETEAALDQRPLPARAAARRADRAGWRRSPAARACATAVGDHPGEDPDAGRLLAAGRLPLRRARPTIRRRASGHGSPTAPRSAGRRRARRWPAPSRSTSRPSRPRCAASSSVSACKPKEVFQPVRVAIAGTHGLAGDLRERRAVLGRDETLRRIDAALAR